MLIHDVTQSALEVALKGTSLRQATIADNLANINTPGYQRRSVDFENSLQAALSIDDADVELVRSTPLVATVDASATMRADGNSVDPDAESAQLARNGLQAEALIAVLKARTGILQTAIGVR